MANKPGFVSEFIKIANTLVSDGFALVTAPDREREAFLAACKRIISGLASHGADALAEAEKLLVIIFQYTEDGIFFDNTAPEKYKTAFINWLDEAGTACQPA